jgi:DNA-binding NarL/FixJ family response regulator
MARRILVADDHEIVRRGVRNLLETRGDLLVVAEAADGREALAAARESAPDIAILDYSLPGLNGLDLTHALKREFPDLQILVYTMHDREEIVSDIFRAGARGFVLKSETETHLLAAIDALAHHQPYHSGVISDADVERLTGASLRPAASPLTSREREIVQLIAEGKSNKQIGHALTISVKTVEAHRSAAMHKLNLHTTAELVRYAVRNRLIDP